MFEWSATPEWVYRLQVAAYRRLVFAMSGDRQRRFREDAFQCLLLVDQEIPGTGADENLDSGCAADRGQFGNVRGCGTDVEAIVDQALTSGQLELLLESLGGHRAGTGVGHVKERRHPPLGTGTRGMAKIFFVRQARFAEMDLIVNHSGQQIEPRGIDHFVHSHLRCRIDVGDPSTVDQDRHLGASGGKHHRGMLDQRLHDSAIPFPQACPQACSLMNVQE
jgi:hypothetical protein